MDETPTAILKSEQDWKQACQDQTDLLTKANHEVRRLTGILEAKDKAHKEKLEQAHTERDEAQRRLIEVTEGKGMVTDEVFKTVSDKLNATALKLDATRKYAETQRKLAISFATKYRELNGVVDQFASDVIAAMEPVLSVINAGNPVPEPTIVRTQCEAERQTTECGQAEPAA